jgi:hypothetical protein
MRLFKVLAASAMVASLAGCSAMADSGQNAQTACYTHRHDYGYPYRGYDGYDYPGANANNCTHPAAVAAADPAPGSLWNGNEGSLGANSAGGGNRDAHTAPVAASANPVTAWNGDVSLGANSAGGGNR